MIRSIAGAAVLVLALAASDQPAAAHDAVGGAIIGAATGALLGGLATRQVDGTIAGAVVGGTAGAILGSDVEKRPGYYWRDGDCFRRVRKGDVKVSRRFCY